MRVLVARTGCTGSAIRPTKRETRSSDDAALISVPFLPGEAGIALGKRPATSKKASASLAKSPRRVVSAVAGRDREAPPAAPLPNTSAEVAESANPRRGGWVLCPPFPIALTGAALPESPEEAAGRAQGRRAAGGQQAGLRPEAALSGLRVAPPGSTNTNENE